MNTRAPEYQALVLAQLFAMDWLPNSMLKKVDGHWMLLLMPPEPPEDNSSHDQQ